MTNQRISTSTGGKRVPFDSEQANLDLLSIRIGASKIPLSEFDPSTISTNGKFFKIPDGLLADHPVTKDQLDNTNTGLQTQIDGLLNNNPNEEVIDVLADATVFAATTLAWLTDNTKLDIEVYVNGRYSNIDKTGGLDQDFRKISSTQLEFVETVPEGSKIVIRKQGTSTAGVVAVAGEANDGANLGTGSQVFKSKVGLDLQFRSIKGINGVDVTENANEIILSSSASTSKLMRNDSGVTIQAFAPVSKRSDGGIERADSDSLEGQAYIGIALAAINAGEFGVITLIGPNLPNALNGLGIASGKDVFLSESGTFIDNPAAYTGGDDSVIKVGVADCATGIVSATATDLIMFTEVLIRP